MSGKKQHGDFHCGECGLTVLAPQGQFTHKCPGAANPPPEYQQARTTLCNACELNQHDVCVAYKELHQDRDCVVTTGIKLGYAACPIGKWGRVVMRCPSCEATLFNKNGPTRCRYCNWRETDT